MAISPIRVLQLILYSFAFGAVCGVAYDIFRLCRAAMGIKYRAHDFKGIKEIRLPVIGSMDKKKKRGKKYAVMQGTVIFFQDIALFLLAAVGTVLLNYYFNYGRPRIYAPFALLLGFASYYFSIGRAVMLLSEPIIFVFRLILSVNLVIFYLPVRAFVEFFVKICKKIGKNVRKAIAKKQKRVYNNKKDVNIAQGVPKIKGQGRKRKINDNQKIF